MTFLERSRHETGIVSDRYTFEPFVSKTDDETGPVVILDRSKVWNGERFGDQWRPWEVSLQFDYCSGSYSDYGCSGIDADDPLLVECLACLDEFRSLRDTWNGQDQ